MADDKNVIFQPKSLISNSDNYVLNGKIMICSVIILSAAVLIMLCFHTYARWLFKHRTRHHPSASSSNNHHHLPTTATNDIKPQQGLDLSILKALPTFDYLSKTAHAPLDCAVCLSEFKDVEKGRVLPNCRHAFHVECIDMWFYSHSNCPLCRAGIEPASSEYGLGCSYAAASLLPPLECERIIKQPLDLDHLV